ncbi:toll/interleukin-1 receptor domain-containing protein [Paenibacillus baimaensis]|nr:toll/interleukin-1 receptor domain-containing protein [Paenibacillus sp. WQ 127069]
MSLFKRSDLIAKADKELLKKSFFTEASTILKSASYEFSSTKNYDIFLSHSYSDAKIILGLKLELEEMGHSVYVDWIEDLQLDRSKVTKETAEQLRTRMKRCKCLFFATSDNSTESKWMPWELGYFDGIKGKVGVIPITNTTSQTDAFEGQEYLGIYNYITKGTVQGSNQMALWVHDSSNVYVRFELWLNGSVPYKRT